MSTLVRDIYAAGEVDTRADSFAEQACNPRGQETERSGRIAAAWYVLGQLGERWLVTCDVHEDLKTWVDRHGGALDAARAEGEAIYEPEPEPTSPYDPSPMPVPDAPIPPSPTGPLPGPAPPPPEDEAPTPPEDGGLFAAGFEGLAPVLLIGGIAAAAMLGGPK